jgi:hypothetical protein
LAGEIKRIDQETICNICNMIACKLFTRLKYPGAEPQLRRGPGGVYELAFGERE